MTQKHQIKSWNTLLNQAIMAIKHFNGEIVVLDSVSCLPLNIRIDFDAKHPK